MELFYCRIFFSDLTAIVSCMARDIEDATSIFIANIDSGDYDYLAPGQEIVAAELLEQEPKEQEILI